MVTLNTILTPKARRKPQAQTQATTTTYSTTRQHRQPEPRYLRCASPPRSNADAVPCISLSQNQNPKQRGERPPILPFPSPAAISPRWPRPPSRQSRRRRPPRRRAWPRATPSLLPQPRAAPRSRSAPPRAGPFSRSAPPRSRLTPSAARTAAPSHPGPCFRPCRFQFVGSIGGLASPLRSLSSPYCVPRRSRRRAQELGAAPALAASTWGGGDKGGCLSCFPKSRRGRSGLARFAPCALPHASGLSFRSRLSGSKVRSHLLLWIDS